MARTVVLKVGETRFLAEVDDSVHVAAIFADSKTEGVPEGFQPVVDVAGLERDFADVRDLIGAVCKSLYDTISNIPKPQKVNVEFGVKLGGEAGIPMLTKASGEASFKVAIEWNPK